MDKLFLLFLKERKYLKNITPKTENYYLTSWSAYKRYTGGCELNKEKLKEWVIAMREAGVKPVSCNTFISAVNAFCNWLYENEYLPEKLKIGKLKCEKPVLPTIPEANIKRLLAFKPQIMGEKRIHTLTLFLLDTGARIDEALTLAVKDVDFDNLLVRLKGKGQKERLIPFSLEMRKTLYKYLKHHPYKMVFCTRDGTKPSHHNLTRDYQNLCDKIGIEKQGCFHRLRHTFALNYVRNGGSLFHLQKQLGHTDLTMTRRYTELQTEDLVSAHTSLLGKFR